MSIIGYVEKITHENISGWACGAAEKNFLTIIVSYGKENIAMGFANIFREDLVNVRLLKGYCSFSIPVNLPKDFKLRDIKVRALDKYGACEAILPLLSVKNRYQTFDGERGDSNSPEKLQKLYLPNDLSGMSVLDLGCNEGFFCFECVRRGAESVTGIDSSEHYIKLAKERDENNTVQFLNVS